jgi:hypothetical protein
MTFMIATFSLKNVYPKLLSVTRTHHTGRGYIPGKIGKDGIIGYGHAATRTGEVNLIKGRF